MNSFTFDLPLSEEVEICPLADVHIGNPLCDEEAFKRTIDYILEEPSNPKRARVCILNGDLTESVTKHSKGNVYDMTLSPQTQIAMMVKYLLPLTETSKKYPMGKIVSYCAGNHDFGRYSDTGVTSAQSIAAQLHIEDRFSTDGCYSFISCKRDNHEMKTLTVYNQHGTGSGATIGSKANRVAKISNGIIADVIICSHLHEPLVFKEEVFMPVKRSLHLQSITYVMTNSFLRHGDYAERAAMKPASRSVPKIIWRTERKMIKGVRDRYTFVEVVL